MSLDEHVKNVDQSRDTGKITINGEAMVELCLLCRIQRRAKDLKLPIDEALREAAKKEQELRKKLKCDSNSHLCRLCNIETDIETLCAVLKIEATNPPQPCPKIADLAASALPLRKAI